MVGVTISRRVESSVGGNMVVIGAVAIPVVGIIAEVSDRYAVTDNATAETTGFAFGVNGIG